MSDERPPPAPLPEPGRIETVAPGVRRLVVPNGGPFTASGTCTYIVGRGRVAVIDPGPDHAGHRTALLAGLAGEEVAAILVTHTHADHSLGAAPLAALTGAPTMGGGPHRLARPPRPGEVALEAGADMAFRPDRILAHGERVEGPGWAVHAIATPGHCPNHLAFALPHAGMLFSGDHVMGWSTTVVAPPDGAMTDYMASLVRLLDRPERLMLPGHGGVVTEPQRLIRATLNHRRMREAAVLARLRGGDATIPALVDALYAGLAPALRNAAALTILAHLEALMTEGRAACELRRSDPDQRDPDHGNLDQPGLGGRYRAL